jgi:hypothetical protein
MLIYPLKLLYFFDTAEFVRHHYHTIKYNGRTVDIMCPAYRLSDESEIIVIPWYLIPGRPYPIQVYLFACSYYCANPAIGQRGAAETTRIKFNLKTFSHSTISRSFRLLEHAQQVSLENRYGKEIKIIGAENITTVSTSPKVNVNKDESIKTERRLQLVKRFPSVADTASRRKVMNGFLPKLHKNANITDIEAAGCRFVKNWHNKSGRLLL